MTSMEAHKPSPHPTPIRKRILALSQTLLKIERIVLITLIGAILTLVLANIFMTASGRSLYWADELAINLMIVSTFVGMSMLTARQSHPSVSLLREFLRPHYAYWLDLIVSLFTLCFCLAMIVLAWIWFDPIGLIKANFNLQAYAGTTKNFMYLEPTNTLGIAKFWIWLTIPICFFAMTFHAFAQIVQLKQKRK